MWGVARVGASGPQFVTHPWGPGIGKIDFCKHALNARFSGTRLLGNGMTEHPYSSSDNSGHHDWPNSGGASEGESATLGSRIFPRFESFQVY
jgi:hypothetical protein